MENYRRDEIQYDEGWQRFDSPVVNNTACDVNDEVEITDQPHNKQNEKRKKQFPSLITLQLILCLFIAFVIFMLKAMDSNYYHQLCAWYNDCMQNTLFGNSVFEDIDLSRYFVATNDEVSTTDEV